MKRRKPPYSILVVRDTGANPVSLKLGAGWFRLALVLAILFVLSLAAFVYYYGRISVRVFQVSAVSAENTRLKKRLAELETLSADLEKIHGLEQKLKALANKKEEAKPAENTARSQADQDHGEMIFEKEIDDYVQNIKTQRNLDFLKNDNDVQKRKQALTSTPNILPVDGWISRGFTDSAAQDKNGHPGIDIAAAVNTPVKAAAPGLVTFSGWKSDWGNLVEVDHGFGFISRYGHCASLLVQKGDLVERSQTIALVGSSGRSSGPHLHFEVLKGGVQVDPLEFVLK